MSVDRSEILRIAKLAQLRFDDDEADRLTEEMNGILEYAARLRELRDDSAEGALETSSSGTRSQDAEVPDVLAGDLRSFAPREVDGFFVVPPPPGLGSVVPVSEDD